MFHALYHEIVVICNILNSLRARMMRKGITAIVLYLSGILLFSGCIRIEDFENYEIRYNGNIEGTVYDLSTNQPIEGVKVFYDYFTGDDENYEDDYYYDYGFPDSTLTNEEGVFLVRNLMELRKHVIMMRKWPGFEQLETLLTPTAQATDSYTFYLKPAVSEFTIEPTSLYFSKEEVSHYLVIINKGNTPFNWTLSKEADWIICLSNGGTLASEDAEIIFAEVNRALIDEGTTEDSVTISILSTGDTRTINISVEK